MSNGRLYPCSSPPDKSNIFISDGHSESTEATAAKEIKFKLDQGKTDEMIQPQMSESVSNSFLLLHSSDRKTMEVRLTYVRNVFL